MVFRENAPHAPGLGRTKRGWLTHCGALLGAIAMVGGWVLPVAAADPKPPAVVPPSVPQAAPLPTTPPAISVPPAALPPPIVVPEFQPRSLPPASLGPQGGIQQAGLRQPAQPIPMGGNVPQPLPGAENLPPPRQLPFGDNAVRRPSMGNPDLLGGTPVPTEQELKDIERFVKGVVDPMNTLDLVVGRARVILLNAVPTRTQIADAELAEFRLLEPLGTQLTIVGLEPGITVLNLWFADPDKKGEEKIISYLVRVFPDPEAKERLEAIYKALEIEINKAFPNSRVRLKLVGDKLMVTGQAHDIVEAVQILRIARANAPDQTGPATRPPLADLGPTGQPLDPLRPDLTPGVESFQTAGGPNVINNLRIPGEQQITLRVTVAEVNRAAARSIGVDFSITNNDGVTVFAQQTGQLLGAAAGGIAGAGGNLPVNLDNGQIQLAIQALRTLNYARALAEPNLTTMNGQTATFLAGGQFPVPVVGGFGNFGFGNQGGIQGVQFVPFGVQLTFSPIITDRDRIRLTVSATVSTRDQAASTTIAGANVPGLNTRTFSTTVELREGQTMAVAGLIQNNLGADAARVPFFGDLPYVGRLFSLQQISHGEQELVVLVTPELVHPLDPNERLSLPGSDIFEPGDMEFYLAGRLESRRSYDYRSPVMTDIHRMLRYRRCEQVYIAGPSGHVDPPDPLQAPAAKP